jgi:hypothetical protein
MFYYRALAGAISTVKSDDRDTLPPCASRSHMCLETRAQPVAGLPLVPDTSRDRIPAASPKIIRKRPKCLRDRAFAPEHCSFSNYPDS